MSNKSTDGIEGEEDSQAGSSETENSPEVDPSFIDIFGEQEDDNSDDDNQDDDKDRTVPYARLEKVSRQNQTLNEKVKALEQQLLEGQKQTSALKHYLDDGLSAEEALVASREDKEIAELLLANKSHPDVVKTLRVIQEKIGSKGREVPKSPVQDTRVNELFQERAAAFVDDITAKWANPTVVKMVRKQVLSSFDFGTEKVTRESVAAKIKQTVQEYSISPNDVLPKGTGKTGPKTKPGKTASNGQPIKQEAAKKETKPAAEKKKSFEDFNREKVSKFSAMLDEIKGR